MIFDLNNLNIEIFKKFDGDYNYFNPSHFNGRTIYRREHKFEGRLLVSDIVDDQDIVLLQHHTDDNFLWSYEDARFINDTEISVCCCKRDKHDIEKIINVEYKKYNLTTKEFTHFKTQNAYFEKHWQFYNDKIIYHVNPYTIIDSNENIIYKKEINLQPWIKKYGKPGLSSNVFDIDGNRYILYHSYKSINGVNLKYYSGILKLNESLHPICYTSDSLFPSVEDYERETFINYFNWKRKLHSCPTIVDVIFPMNVIVDDEYVNIYSGINDCICANIKIDKQLFIDKIKNEPFILL
jgi:hypothetical protein